MDKNDLKQFLVSNIPSARIGSGGKQIICNCVFPGCDDTKGHLYIGPFESNDNEPIMYNCYKCRNSGIVNIDFLSMFGLDNDIGKEVIKANKVSSYRTYVKNKDIIYNVNNNYVTECEVSRYKLNYINNRLGLSLTYQDCLNCKIVLNLGDLIQSNSIKYFTRNIDIVKQLNKNFIGFLSRSNGSLNMRNLEIGPVHDNINAKYINYNLFKTVAKNDYYIIPTSFNIDEHLKIYIGEGPFDILSIYFNVIQDHYNSVFIAGKGKAYLSAVQFMILNYGIYDFEVHYFPDKDVSDYFMRGIVNTLKVFGCDIYIHRNVYQNEKDFGVPRDRIVDRVIKV